MMNVLVISPNWPQFPGSGAPTRLHCLAREMAKTERLHLIHISPDQYNQQGESSLFVTARSLSPALPLRLPQPLRRLKAIFQRLFGPPAWVSSLLPFRRELATVFQGLDYRPDLIHIDHTFTAAPLRGLLPQTPRLVDVHDLIHKQNERLGKLNPVLREKLKGWIESRKALRWERELLRSVNSCSVVSELDKGRVQDLAPGVPVLVVPNGVDCHYFQPGAASRGSCSLLFIGKLDYLPNFDAVTWMAASILPLIRRRLPDVQFHVVGMNPSPELYALQDTYGFVLHGEVPDTRPYLAAASIVVIPLRAGSGTRLKILEALACQKPVVSTRIGAEGLEVEDGKHLVLADEEKQFAEAVLDLHSDFEFSQKLAGQGRELAQRRYDWRVIAPVLHQAYETAVAK